LNQALLPGWLFGIDLARIGDPSLRAKLERYQEECFGVLWRAFQPEIMPTPAPASDLTGAALALEIATAVQALARDHLALEARVGDLAGKHDTMAGYLRGWIKATNTRLDALESRLDAGGTIDEAQALEIAGAVKAIAYALESQGVKGTYQQVWGDLYRRYRVSAYRNLPVTRFAEGLAWLQGWHAELQGPEAKPRQGAGP